ncbi:PRC-barrel domain-containing protein [Undibacterium sp. RuRC25W]|uniref:PRC-barrel domain-containing protein n=1 Tax=Undibacterium sp. RuRC25W TaxID=3413047 RepID=UPI003BF28754
MKKIIITMGFVVLGNILLAPTCMAQVAGSTTVIGVTVLEARQMAMGWSVKKSVLGKDVFNDAGVGIGKIEDVIISPEKNVTYFILNVGGFIGIGGHNVAIPVAQIVEQNGKIVLPGATKESITNLPQFDYASDTAKRDAFVASAEQDLARAKEQAIDLQKRAALLNGDAKSKLDQQYALLQEKIQITEKKLNEMKRAGASRWQEFEHDLSVDLAHLKLSLSNLGK